jgi:signal transduction histidine kinase
VATPAFGFSNLMTFTIPYSLHLKCQFQSVKRKGPRSGLPWTAGVRLIESEFTTLIRGERTLVETTMDTVARKAHLHMTLAGIDVDGTDSIHGVQVAQVVRAIPLLILFHASAALGVFNLTASGTSNSLLYVWQAAVALTGIALALTFLFWRNGHWHSRPERVLRGLELLCLVLGLVWAAPAAAAIYIPQQNGLLPIAGISLAMLGVGVASLIRVPTGAIVFVAVIAATLARALYVGAEDFNLVAALVCAICGLVLAGIVINSHVDFVRRSRLEIEVQQRADYLQHLLSDFERHAKDWLWQTDAQGRLTYFSTRFAEAVGIAPGDLKLRPLRHVLADVAQNDDWRKLDFAMADEAAIQNLELALLVGGKPVVWCIAGRAVRNTRGTFTGYRGVIHDVTLTQEAQHRIELAMEARERASATKSQFLGVISHELRTPINAISGFAELLANERMENIPQNTRVEFSRTILENSRQLQELINDILDTTRIERGSLKILEQDVDAAELVEAAIQQCRVTAEKNRISIVGRLTDGVSLKGDSYRLRQVVVNLLANAIKFSLPDGIVNVEMQKGHDGQLVLVIKDAGVGIPDGALESIFEPFVQADTGLTRRHVGAGLGLPIARRIARLHGGDVVLESLAGAGTSALFVLPKFRIQWPVAESAEVKDVA